MWTKPISKLIFNETVQRKRLVDYVLNHSTPDCLIVMEACWSSHYLGRIFQEFGYCIKLIPAQHVKALTRGNKSDAHDALAIAESGLRPAIHEVPVKTVEQQEVQSLLRVRGRYQMQRVDLINQSRGLLREFGIVIPRGEYSYRVGVPEILEDGENGLTMTMRKVIHDIYEEFLLYTTKLKTLEKQLTQISKQHVNCRQLQKIRGIGLISVMSLYCSVGQGDQFKNGCSMSAWLGLVPRQYGTGGKMRLGAISKRGSISLRRMLIHGARSVLNHIHNRNDSLSEWIKSVIE